MSKYFRIGELARLYHISTDSLRYYEELGLLIPKRSPNNYRLYSSEDLWRLNIIRDLRALDFSMESIREYLNNHTVASTLSMINEEIDAVDRQIARLKESRRSLCERRSAVLSAASSPVGTISVKSLPERRCHCIPQGYASDSDMDLLIKQLVDFDSSMLYIIGNCQMGSILRPASFSKEKYRDYEGVFILHSEGETFLPQGEYLSISYRGSCDQNRFYVPLLLQYAKKNGFSLLGPFLELLVLDIHTSSSQEEHIAELQFRIRRAEPF